jgi:hypothetical protein
MKTRRSAVFVIPNYIVGHELMFRHYTNKVVVGEYTDPNAIKISKQINSKERRAKGAKN